MSHGDVAQDAAHLAALAAGLCQDASVGVEVHDAPTWSWDPTRRVILVAAADLRERGHVWCAGVLAHEVAHFHISRYLHFAAVSGSDRADILLLNAIEDPRVEAWIVRRYPGTARWLEEIHAAGHHAPAGLPHFFRFCFECAAEPTRGWLTEADPELPAEVAAALERTRSARREYVAVAPPVLGERTLDPAMLRAGYRDEVWPQLRSEFRRHAPPAREQEVRLHAWRAAALALDDILPIARELIDADVERLAGRLDGDDQLQRAARAAARRRDHAAAGRVVAVPAGAAPDSLATPTTTSRSLARAVFELVFEQATTGPAAARRGQAGARGGSPRGLPAGPLAGTSVGGAAGADRPPPPPADIAAPAPRSLTGSSYDLALDRLGLQVDHLVARVEEILRPRRRLQVRDGYPSGTRISLARLMQFEADPRHYTALWSRTSLPERRDAAVLLLVDLSGSMRGDKTQAALLGTILLAETCTRLGVPCGVYGFQDELIPLLAIGDSLDAEVQQALASLPGEIEGNRPGGHNKPGYNDDGPCLAAAAGLLRERPETDRLLIVISDGLPEGRRSDEDDLRRAIADLTRPPVDLQLTALGLGDGTDHVTEFYPHAIANVPVNEFAARIGDLLEQALVGSPPPDSRHEEIS